MTSQTTRIVHVDDVEPNRRRGGDLRAMLTPTAVGATSGFMGVAIVQPGDRIGEHYHPYSEEFLHVVAGTLDMALDGVPTRLVPGDSLLVPIGVRHRLVNVGTCDARVVFHLSPLAPRPDLGHVDTEGAVEPGAANPDVGGAR